MRRSLGLLLLLIAVPHLASAADGYQLADAMDIDPMDVSSAVALGDPVTNDVITALGTLGPMMGGDMAVLFTGDVAELPVTPPNDTDIGNDGVPATDFATLDLELTVPPGMNSFYLAVNFLSREYPDYVGGGFNDVMTLEVTSQECNGSIGYDPLGNPLEIDSAAFIDVTGDLTGTFFEGHGFTDWVWIGCGAAPGDAVQLHLQIEDVTDGVFDSAVLLDGFFWDADDLGGPVSGYDSDQDGDGFLTTDGDCDDFDPNAYPGGPEVCDDGIDGDCGFDLQDTEVDDDGDGQSECAGDCDDTEPAVYDGNTEICDGLDNDCNGVVDDGMDNDGDGVSSCGGDCDDNDASVYPGAPDLSDGIDNDCDGLVDEDAVDVGDVIITEAHINPDLVADSAGEWIELYNVTGDDIYLQEWILRDDGTDAHTLVRSPPLVIAANSYLVLGRNTNPGQNGGVTLDYEYGADVALANNNGDEIVLELNGIEIDAVRYDNSFPYAQGVAMQLDANSFDDLDNDDPAFWCEATLEIAPGADMGTPGADNEECFTPGDDDTGDDDTGDDDTGDDDTGDDDTGDDDTGDDDVGDDDVGDDDVGDDDVGDDDTSDDDTGDDDTGDDDTGDDDTADDDDTAADDDTSDDDVGDDDLADDDTGDDDSAADDDDDDDVSPPSDCQCQSNQAGVRWSHPIWALGILALLALRRRLH